MAGSITKVNNVTYRFSVMRDGKRFTKQVKCENVKNDFKNDKKLQELLKEFIEETEKANYNSKDYRLVEYSDIWVKDVLTNNFSPVSVSKNNSYLKNRIIPFFGNIKIKDITPLQVQAFYNHLKNSKTNKRCGHISPLSKGSVEKIAYVLSSMLENAKQMGIISSNPCRNVKLNFTCEIQDEIHYFDKHQYIQILQLLSHETLEHQTIIELALKTGMRRSEMFGLTYNDIDFINNSISINKSRHRITGQGMQTKSTKTKNSIRVIAIPQSLTALLLKYKSKYPHNEYIFDNLSIDGISQWWRKFQIKNHFKNIRFHDLRHTHATLLLLQGVDLKTIQHRLGHADISITMSVYAHVCQELDVNACTKLDALEK